MSTKIENWKGTVAYSLNKHKSEIDALLNVSYLTAANFGKLKSLINNILDTDTEIRLDQAQKAKNDLFKSSNYSNHYLSTLAAYMTGIAVGK